MNGSSPNSDFSPAVAKSRRRQVKKKLTCTNCHGQCKVFTDERIFHKHFHKNMLNINRTLNDNFFDVSKYTKDWNRTFVAWTSFRKFPLEQNALFKVRAFLQILFLESDDLCVDIVFIRYFDSTFFSVNPHPAILHGLFKTFRLASGRSIAATVFSFKGIVVLLLIRQKSWKINHFYS